MILEVKGIWLLKCFWKRVITASLHFFITCIWKLKYTKLPTILIPAAVPVSSLMCPRFHLGVTVRPERLAPAQASLQTHARPADTPDGPAPALWPYWLHSAKQEARLSWAMFSSFTRQQCVHSKHLIWLFELCSVLSSYIILNLEWVIQIYEKKNKWEMRKTLINF